jgi:hypothetical protein
MPVKRLLNASSGHFLDLARICGSSTRAMLLLFSHPATLGFRQTPSFGSD